MLILEQKGVLFLSDDLYLKEKANNILKTSIHIYIYILRKYNKQNKNLTRNFKKQRTYKTEKKMLLWFT